MREDNTPKRKLLTKLDLLVICSVLAIAWAVAFAFTESAGVSVVIAFVRHWPYAMPC
jgi:hypothetical protein